MLAHLWPHYPAGTLPSPAEFDRRFLTFEVPAEVARQQRAKFLAARKPETPVVSPRGCSLPVPL